MTKSGTRGLIGSTLTPELALKIGQSFGTYIQSGTVIVGGDTRTSYEMLNNAIISGLISVGINVIDIGKVPTPTVQHLIRHHKADGGIVITASHNPIEWNGIKLMNRTGSFLDTEEYEVFEKAYNNAENIKLATWDKLGKVTLDKTALEVHVDKVLSLIDTSSLKNSQLKVLADPNNGTGCLINPVLFKKLGLAYHMINAEPNGRFAHNPEPLKKNLDGIIAELSKGKYDIGFVQDADADRLVILDETGRFIGEDYSLALEVDYILSNLKEDNKKVVVNLSTSMVVEDIARKHKADITYTKVGESNVTEGIKKLNAQIGGEGNGGIIYPKVGWGRDSIVGMIIALKYLAESQKTVSEIVATYPKYTMLREKISVSNHLEVQHLLTKIEDNFKEETMDKLDGLKILLPDSWIHVRPSNTEPIVRIFIEAKTEPEAQNLFSKIKKCL
jgi:phosphomannomutase